MTGTFVLALAACGSWSRVGSQDQVDPGETLTQIFDAPRFFRGLGRLAAGDPMPFVGDMAFLAGPGDSVRAVLALSLENRAFTFQREGAAFVARYEVNVTLERPGAEPIPVNRTEAVRVATYQETQRAEESVLFQQNFSVVPGEYQVTVKVRDPVSNAESQARQAFTVPDFASGTTSAPILAYQATGRGNEAEPVGLVLNPRGAVAYGGDTLLAYIEGYAFDAPATVPFEVRTEADSVVYVDSLRFQGGLDVESQVLRMRPDSMALGELRLVVGEGDAQRVTRALISFSSAWVITNFDEMLSLLRYFGEDNLLAQMREAPDSVRADLWRQFYRNTDPNPTTPENEALNSYFSRVSMANQRFRDESVAGWRTDRGEVFITLGEPDEVYNSTPTGGGGRVIRWTYIADRLNLFFVDETGFGRYRITPSGRAEFERALSRRRRAAEG
ncbi:MAG: GWxTD domain-containing protein [Gemmatimonadota bacterium]|nr:GWxTD domain-containing protein [Gemmatimonadota bacterium]